MRGLTRRWILPDSGASPHRELLRRVLAARGLDDPDGVRGFCEPRLTDLHDPGLLPDVDRAAERLVDAARSGERIVIYGDYDVDGITATAILFHMIRAAAPEADLAWYVPHRLDEGYGINLDAMRRLAAEGARVVVSVDCGITAVEGADLARELGLDLIVTDHHNPDTGAETGEVVLPDAFAVVHPRLPGGAYPFGELCGAGVAFKLAWRFATTWCRSERVSEHLQRTLLDMLPLAALGTIADVVPLVGENRIIARHGLRLMERTPLPGLRGLIETARLSGARIESEQVGFILAPRLNACGRMGHAAEAVRMLTDAPPEEAKEIAGRLTRLNDERRRTEQAILAEAESMAEAAGMTGDGERIIVLAHESWHPGVVGIVCSRLTERHGRPAILMQARDGVCKGSARSIPGYSIHAALAAAAEHLGSFGGHDAAAGLALPEANLAPFRAAMSAHARGHISEDQLVPEVRVDCAARLDEIDHDAVRGIATLSPFGRDNPRPTLLVEGAVLAEPPRPMGSRGRHLSLRLRQETAAGRRAIRVVWWNRGDLAPRFATGMPLDILIEPKLNSWGGRVSVEGELRDVRVRE